MHRQGGQLARGNSTRWVDGCAMAQSRTFRPLVQKSARLDVGVVTARVVARVASQPTASRADLRQPATAAGMLLARKEQVRAHAQHAPRPIRAGIAGSHPDPIPGPALRHDQPQSRCLQSVHPTPQTKPIGRKMLAKSGPDTQGGQVV